VVSGDHGRFWQRLGSGQLPCARLMHGADTALLPTPEPRPVRVAPTPHPSASRRRVWRRSRQCRRCGLSG
jgi:hypothetical protein